MSQQLLSCRLVILFLTIFSSSSIITQTVKAQCPDNSNYSGIIQQDYTALQALYNATNGPSWVYSDSEYNSYLTNGEIDTPNAGTPWSFSTNNMNQVCGWHGIKLTADGLRVKEIILENANLNGFLPPELANLDSLTVLTLGENCLTGTIPDSLGSLENLIVLYLQRNNLDGSIPPELGQLSNLQQLSLSENQLEGSIPTELGCLENLTRLLLQNNKLSGTISADLGNLANLEHLYLQQNQFVFGDLDSVYNDFISTVTCPNSPCFQYAPQSEIPISSNGDTLSVDVGDIAGNTYTWHKIGESIPVKISGENWFVPGFGGTYDCKVTNNLITVSDWEEQELILTSESVIFFGAYCADILSANTAILNQLYDATAGANWTSSNNWSSTSVATWYGVTLDELECSVKELDLGDNNLEGIIPETLGNLAYLEVLKLNTNALTDTIPSILGNLYNLNNLWLFSNDLTGSIPSELGNLIKLTSLLLLNNNLEGTIPPELGNLENLVELNLGNNNLLNGVIPSELGNLDSLKRLTLAQNNLSDSIPAELGNLSLLENLFLHENQLSGSIPAELGNLNNLTRLFLQDNQLSGLIPAELGNLNNLLEVKLQKNQFTFGDLVPIYNNWINLNCTTNQPCFQYAPQANIPTHFDSINISLYVEAGDVSNNTYKWYEVGNTNPDTTIVADSLFMPAPRGIYYCKVTNSEMTNENDTTQNLVLTSNEYHFVSPLCLENRLEDSLVLVNFYEATNGSNWTNTSNWETGILDNWTEVSLDYYRCGIKELKLSGKSLTGILPAELSLLDSLTILDLSNNTIAGAIPTALGNLSSLTHLDLSNNTIAGAIPTALGNLSSLTHLDLSSDTLTGSIPAELGNLNSLNHLDLSNNHLGNAIPSQIGNLDSLNHLNLSNNELDGSIPPELGNLDSLNHLNLSNNQLSNSIPAELGNLNSLSHLDLSNNELSGIIPADLGDLTLLDLSNNQFIFSDFIAIIDELGNISSESGVNFPGLSHSPQDTIPTYLISGSDSLYVEAGDMANNTYYWYSIDEMGNTISIDTISYSNIFVPTINGIYYCEVTNSLITNQEIDAQNLVLTSTPIEFTATSCASTRIADSLVLVTLYQNLDSANWTYNDTSYYNYATNNSTPIPNPGNVWLNGSIDTWHGVTLTTDGCRVSQIILENNNLTGTLPAELGNLDSLTVLNLSGNQLMETIPTELGDLDSLMILNLSNNQLTGTIPIELGNLFHLTHLYLNNNQLSDSIPIALRNLTKLIVLNLSENELTNSIPADLGNLVNLTDLYLNNNQLIDSIPVELGNLVNLANLYLNNNQLTGSIPTDLDNLANLTNLYLNNNQLTGSVPTDLGNFANLTNLYLNNNQLTGSIPTDLGNLNMLMSLNLSNNQLSGSVPTEFGNLNNLVELYLNNNQLSGSIPVGFSTPSNLTTLLLATNQFVFGDLVTTYSSLSQTDTFHYAPQDTIPIFLMNEDSLHVEAGDIDNNTYVWYEIEDSINPIFTTQGHHFFSPTQNGTYYCEVTNGVMTIDSIMHQNLILISQPHVFELVCKDTVSMPQDTTLYVCYNGSVVATSNTVVDEDSDVRFYIHAGDMNILTNVIGRSTDSTISFDDLDSTLVQYNTTYYVSAVVGPTNGTDSVDLNSPCTVVAAGTPIIFEDQIVLNIDSDDDDLSTCEGGEIILSINDTNTLQSYIWSNNTEESSITVSESGTYSVAVTDVNYCTAVESVDITIFPLPTADAGEDVCMCSGDTLTLDGSGSTSNIVTYTWSNPSTALDDTTSQLTIDTSGRYFLIVYDQNDCWDSTSVVVTQVTTPIISGNFSFPTGGSTTLNAGEDYTNYLWSNEVETQITTINAAGDYTVTVSGENGCQCETTVTVNESPIDAQYIELKVYLEGAYLSPTSMTNDLQSMWLPNNQPYNMTPWNYSGTESISDFQALGTIVDWVLIELKDSVNQDSIVAQKAALLRTDGTVVDTQGSSFISFEGIDINTACYVILRHRNHLDIASALAHDFSTPLSLDFTLNDTDVLQGDDGNNQLKEVEAGIYAMRAGDFNGDGTFNIADYNTWLASVFQNNVYALEDCNFDGKVFVQDYQFWFVNNPIIGVDMVQY